MTQGDHTHDEINEINTKQGIPEHTRSLILHYIERSIATTARAIVKQLEFEKKNDPLIEIPTYLQINNLKSSINAKQNPTDINFGDHWKF